MHYRGMGPLLTESTIELLLGARATPGAPLQCTLDLGRSLSEVAVGATTWGWRGGQFPYPAAGKERTIYYWDEGTFQPAARFTRSLVKLVPTEFGPPTFEIDGIKMLPTSQGSPYADAERKVALVRPAGKIILDTCGGLGYFAACCLSARAVRIISFEKNPDVIWLRGLNPWSPGGDSSLTLIQADVTDAVKSLSDGSVHGVLHDPPRFGIAGELYSQQFYQQLWRVLKPRGRLFHYTGSPNRASSGRDLAAEVTKRLRAAGFGAEKSGDGVLAIKG